ncbi:MAG: phospho-N-acetylmuramoyl-pentapeptide-transferase [Holosporales bacterium]|jgi:phospho-N-acetylmuramoyl-pentapeptide-transferase|nr:phospho-N-acetylmuramoyl-pentapeptide-transferase [Holosporales bacterium]
MFYNFIYKFYGSDFSFCHIFKYITFRSICAFFTSFIALLLFGHKIIHILKKNQMDGQPIREDGPKSHLESKKGIPTMGGTMILASILLGTLLWGDLESAKVWLCLGVLIGFGAIGAIDDTCKLRTKDYHGISGKKKLFLQSVVALVCWYFAVQISNYEGATSVFFPIFKHCSIELGSLFILWAMFVTIGSSNAVNLTDGLDGLAMGPTIMSSICLAVISYLGGNVPFADYLYITYVPGLAEVCVFLSALVGASLGFMWFNAPPAKIFMGDTGSISIGAALGFVAVLSKHEMIYAIVGGIFVLETISVILQVGFYKMTQRRIFLMAPIHHHFEKKGWSESMVVFRFWIISIVLGILALGTLKIR